MKTKKENTGISRVRTEEGERAPAGGSRAGNSGPRSPVTDAPALARPRTLAGRGPELRPDRQRQARQSRACIGCGASDRASLLTRPSWLFGWPVCAVCLDRALVGACYHAGMVPAPGELYRTRHEPACRVCGAPGVVEVSDGVTHEPRGYLCEGHEASRSAMPLPEEGREVLAVCVDCRPDSAQDCERCEAGGSDESADAQRLAGLRAALGPTPGTGFLTYRTQEAKDTREAMGLPPLVPVPASEEEDTPAPTCNLGVVR